MSPRCCPECKSHNTRQMDREHFGDQAYCLSCYNKFRSVSGPIETKSIRVTDRGILRITERLERIERSLNVAKKDLKEVLNGKG
jgi:hypothetical protein